MTDDLSPQLGGQSDVTGREPELSGARATATRLMFDKLVDDMALLHFHIATGAPMGQRWAEFEQDGRRMGAVLSEDNLVYVFPVPERPVFRLEFEPFDYNDFTPYRRFRRSNE